MHKIKNSEACSAKLSLHFNTFIKNKVNQGIQIKLFSGFSESPLMDHRPFNKDETSLKPS